MPEILPLILFIVGIVGVLLLDLLVIDGKVTLFHFVKPACGLQSGMPGVFILSFPFMER